MRDYRDAKVMAQTARTFLADHGLRITHSQSLELIAKAFGAADWNTLSAAIRGESASKNAATSPAAIDAGIGPSVPRFSKEIERTFQRALCDGDERDHQYTTLEHLLLALTDDANASKVMRACGVDLAVLQKSLTGYIENELPAIVTTRLVSPQQVRNAIISGTSDFAVLSRLQEAAAAVRRFHAGRRITSMPPTKVETGPGGSLPTAAFQRVKQRAVSHAEQMGQQEVTGDNVMVAIFAERESPAVRLLHSQNMTAQDAADFVERGIIKGSGTAR